MTAGETDTPPSGADAVVVGTGVIGAAVALEPARTGRRVVVVDKAGGVDHGSTSASSAIIRFTCSTRSGVATAWESQHCWARWAEHLGTVRGPGPAAFRPTGAVLLDAPDSGTSEVVALVERAGVPYEALGRRAAGSPVSTQDAMGLPGPCSTMPSSPVQTVNSAHWSHPTRASSTIHSSRHRTSRTRRPASERASSSTARSSVSRRRTPPHRRLRPQGVARRSRRGQPSPDARPVRDPGDQGRTPIPAPRRSAPADRYRRCPRRRRRLVPHLRPHRSGRLLRRHRHELQPVQERSPGGPVPRHRGRPCRGRPGPRPRSAAVHGGTHRRRRRPGCLLRQAASGRGGRLSNRHGLRSGHRHPFTEPVPSGSRCAGRHRPH